MALRVVVREVVVAKVAAGGGLQCFMAEKANFFLIIVEALDQERRWLQVTHADQRASHFKA